MPVIQLSTSIAAPIERCFDLSLDVEAHLASTAATGERVVSGPTSGRLTLGDTVEWEGRHFWVRQRHTSRITEYQRPHRFVDEMVRGAFHRFRHLHRFEARAAATLMVDTLAFQSPLGWLGWAVDRLVLERYLSDLLRRRNEYLKARLEATEEHR